MSLPVLIVVKRWKCPHCSRSRSRQSATAAHIARCWNNPDAKGCKTCKHFEHEDWGDDCAVGVDLSGRPPCGACYGTGETFDAGSLGVSECQACGGDAAEIKPGPIIGCPKWEPSPNLPTARS